MALPKAAQAQVEAAEKLHAEAYTPAEETPNEPPKEDPPAEATTLSEVPPTPESPPAPAEPPPTPPAEDWEHKYKVLQGKYNAEIPRLTENNTAMAAQLQDLQARMNEMAGQMAQPGEEVTPSQHLTPEQIEDYGEEMIDVVRRAAREEFEPQMQQLRQENTQLRGLLGGMQQQTVQNAQAGMLTELDSAVPNWREINQHPDFLGWLENVDVYSGHRKLDLLRQAFENNNATRVLSFFKGFLNENAMQTPSPAPSAEPTVSLDTLVAPGKAQEGGEARAQGNEPQGRVWTQSDISAFYRDVNRGVYRNDPDERTRVEADLFAAQQDGRIRP